MKKAILSLSLGLVIAGLSSTGVQAQDNPEPSSWRNIVVKITETYGNNQSRPLRGAKVVLTLEDSNNNAGLTTRFPQAKTSGSRGATFSRMPPSSIVGNYVVTVDPKPNDKTNKYSCKETSKTFIHSTRKTTKQFNVNCQLNRSTPKVAQSNSTAKEGSCHKVRIQKQEGQRKSTHTKACLNAQNQWVVEPFKY